MTKFSSRGLVALGMVGLLAVATPVLASAGSAPVTPAQQRSYHKAIVAYRDSRYAIQLSFQSAVNAAKSSLASALALATTSAERSTAQQISDAAIIQAASTRSAALTALGKVPVRPS